MYKIECLTQMDAEFNQHNAVCDPYGGACNPEVYDSCGPDCPPAND